MINFFKDKYVKVTRENWTKIEKLFSKKEQTIIEQNSKIYKLEQDILIRDKKIEELNEDILKISKKLDSYLLLEKMYLEKIHYIKNDLILAEEKSLNSLKTRGESILDLYS